MEQKELHQVLTDNFLPYAVSVIRMRAIPEIDGLKKVNRRILYSMKKVGGRIGSAPIKSLKVNGVCTELHPHGDDSIYGALVNMVDTHECLNVPYIKGESNFGKSYSANMPPADARYTKSSLSPICEYIFDGLDEGGVDIIPNYDGTTTEPALLPVAFPTILINSIKGIAVGMAQDIPKYGLKGACHAVIGLMDGSIQTEEEFTRVIGVPQFPFGGTINSSFKELLELTKTGSGSLRMTGDYTVDGNTISITSLPYGCTIETFIGDVKKGVANKIFNEIKSVKDLDGSDGMLIEVQAKSGTDMEMLEKKLLVNTRLNSKISFETLVLIDGKPRRLSVMELAKEWIQFRVNTVKRVYSYRMNKAQEKAEELLIWRAIQEKTTIEALSKDLASCKTDKEAEEYLRQNFDATEDQIKYFLKLSLLTKEREQKEMAKLERLEQETSYYQEILEDDTRVYQSIIEELQEIVQTFGREERTKHGEVLTFLNEKREEIKDESTYYVSITDAWRYKKARTQAAVESTGSDDVVKVMTLQGYENLYVVTQTGIQSIEVGQLQDTRGEAKGLEVLFEEVNPNEIVGVYTGKELENGLNLIYKDGTVVYLTKEKATGKSASKGKLYPKYNIVRTNIYESFFVITTKRRAVYMDMVSRRMLQPNKNFKFKSCRLQEGEEIFGIQPLENVPNKENLDLEKYWKMVPITDTLW